MLEMLCVGTEPAQGEANVWVRDDDEAPRLPIPGRAGPARDVDHGANGIGRNGPVVERAHRSCGHQPAYGVDVEVGHD
ncbi:MAG: hypothetical protein L0I76_00740 [Pseudonocardia sp.]|nr:hypothetical protein [Pseudonocardia sp.]